MPDTDSQAPHTDVTQVTWPSFITQEDTRPRERKQVGGLEPRQPGVSRGHAPNRLASLLLWTVGLCGIARKTQGCLVKEGALQMNTNACTRV